MSTRAWSRLTPLVAFLAACIVSTQGGSNTFPRFSLGGISEIVVRIKEGPGSLGQPLYRLRGEDADGDTLTFGAQGPEGPEILRFERVSATEADVFLRHELDREVKDSHTIVLTLTDGRLPEGQYITQTMLIIVDDVNDNEPVFKQYRSTITVPEDASPHVIDTVEAIDRDQGPFGQVIYQLQNTDPETTSTFSVHQDKGKGIISLTGPLDYERKFIYELRVLAIDRANTGPRHTATAVVLVKVDDVEDQPPIFTQVPPVTRISEDLPLNSVVLTVKAMDGDRGVNNAIHYSIVSGGNDLFAIDRETGVVSVKGRLDREATENRNGAFILLVQAQEVSGKVKPAPSTRTEVTVLLTDVNDEEPAFRSRRYIAEINENAQINVPVNFVGESVPEVFDHDQGSNGTFQLFLQEDNGVFDVTPAIGVNEASFMIRVKNPDYLDYERVKVMNFKIVAREMVSNQPKTSTADVTVHIKDANDNFPVFREDLYRATIPENAAAGTVVTVVRAEDADSEIYGTSGIRYTSIRGQIADKLRLDPEMGKVVVATSAHGLDRETAPEHFLTVEARDENGRGNRNTVQLHLVLEDINDNAPAFVLPSYEARIRENALDFRTPLVVMAVDSDQAGGPNSQVRYQIVHGDPDNNFTIDEVKGRIKPRLPLDFERIAQPRGDVRTFNLLVRAYDMGRPSLSSNVTVVIYVQDVNDHAPEFPTDFVSKAIPEDIQEGTAVVRVLAEDHDHSPSNSKVVYRIQNGAQDKFVIDALTGVISVAPGANMDPDRTFPKSILYSLQILALDGGLGEQQKSSMITVNISIIDVNNKAPRFDEPGTVNLVENSVVGHTVAVVRATDQDDRPMLRYSLCHGTASEARNEDGGLVSEFDAEQSFEINNLEGKVMVKSNIDREVMESIKLCVKVEDMAAATPGQTATATLTVNVVDVNDNRPSFKKSVYRQTVTENSMVGAPIVTARAIDADKNRTVYYSLEGKMEYLALIGIDRKTGEVTVADKIDREAHSWINVTLKATDSGVPPLSGATELQIQVLDENDNNPIFRPGPSEFAVSEDAPLGASVAAVQAVDADVGDYGRITYALDAAGTDGKFKIDRDTGVITVTMPLDREETSSYSLIVQAWDNYEAGFGTDESRRTFKQISIRVLDVNDEVPVFVRQTHCAEVTEFIRIHETVFLASAMDADDPTTPNARIVFTIQAGYEADLFEVESLPDNTARVSTRYSLRGRVGNATVALRAQDQGLPPRSSVQMFSVCVADVNDHSPVFVKPPQNHTIRIPENATLGTVVVEVGAEDSDFGANAEVRYRLKDLPNGHWRTFRLDERTGVITLRQTLDRETQKVYELRVEAYDLGQPTSLSSDLDLTVFVTDVNDYAPEFTEDVHQLTFTENLKPGVETYKLISTIDRDDDLSILKPIPCYYIVGGNEKGRFVLDIFTHQLSATEPLDREEQANYTLVVRASDDCFHEPRPVSRFDPKDNTLLQVEITVLDVNDNPPRFVSRVFTGGVTMEADFGVVFMTVKAIDRDEGINSVVSYYIGGEIRRTLSEGLESLTGPPFLINHRTGDLSLNFYPQKGMKGYFDFEVIANDTEGFYDTASVFIYLLREDQRVRFVLRLTPEEFREKMEEFREVLANITGAIVNIDEYKVHENEDGSVDRKKSDLYLHFVNRDDNSIIEVSNVLTLIDKNIEFLDKLFKEFNVLYSEPADALSDAEREEDQMRTWLIGLSVFLSVMLALVISLCLAQRSRYERQLKAATATAFGSRDSALNRMDVPNTNQHSVEGSNPIWMHSYDNEWYKEDEETRAADRNSLDENAVAEPSGSTSSSTDTHRQTQDREFDSAQLCSEVYVLSNGTVQNISIPVGGSTDLLCPEVAERNNLNRNNKNGGCPYASVFLTKMGTPNRAGKLEVSEL